MSTHDDLRVRAEAPKWKVLAPGLYSIGADHRAMRAGFQLDVHVPSDGRAHCSAAVSRPTARGEWRMCDASAFTAEADAKAWAVVAADTLSTGTTR